MEEKRENIPIQSEQLPDVAVYINQPGTGKVLYCTDPLRANLKLTELVKEDPKIAEKIVVEGEDIHLFLQREFEQAMNDDNLDKDSKKKVFRVVVSSSLESLFNSISEEKDDITIQKRFENAKYFVDGILKCKNRDLCNLFETGLNYSAINHSINTCALVVNAYDKRDALVGFVEELKEKTNGFITQEDIQKALDFLEYFKTLSPESIAYSGFFHDIGKAKDKELFSYKGKFNDQQRESMKKHPRDGFEILKKCNVKDPLVLYGALFHHWRPNGMGYPKVTPEEMKMYQEYFDFLRLIDSFEAMTSGSRSYQSHIGLNGALAKIKDEINENPKDPIFPKHLYAILTLSFKEVQNKE